MALRSTQKKYKFADIVSKNYEIDKHLHQATLYSEIFILVTNRHCLKLSKLDSSNDLNIKFMPRTNGNILLNHQTIL